MRSVEGAAERESRQQLVPRQQAQYGYVPHKGIKRVISPTKGLYQLC